MAFVQYSFAGRAYYGALAVYILQLFARISIPKLALSCAVHGPFVQVQVLDLSPENLVQQSIDSGAEPSPDTIVNIAPRLTLLFRLRL